MSLVMVVSAVPLTLDTLPLCVLLRIMEVAAFSFVADPGQVTADEYMRGLGSVDALRSTSLRRRVSCQEGSPMLGGV